MSDAFDRPVNLTGSEDDRRVTFGSGLLPPRSPTPDFAMLPSIILALVGADENYPQLPQNRATFDHARENIAGLFEQAVNDESWQEWVPHLTAALVLLRLQPGPFNLLPSELDVALESIGGLAPDLRTILDSVSGEDDIIVNGVSEGIHDAIYQSLGLTDGSCRLRLRCDDGLSPFDRYTSLVVTATGSPELHRLTLPIEWPKLVPEFWRALLESPVIGSHPGGCEPHFVHELLDFGMEESPYGPLRSLQAFRNVAVCLWTCRKSNVLNSGRTKWTLEYQLSNPGDTSHCTNPADAVFTYDSGFVDVLETHGDCATLIQQKVVGYSPDVSQGVIPILRDASCYAWANAIASI